MHNPDLALRPRAAADALQHEPRRQPGARERARLITCPACGAWVGCCDAVMWRCDHGHVIYTGATRDTP